MERHIDLREISDGRLYGLNDMVRADCGGCEGCFTCCTGMGSSIVLDPLDIYRLTSGLSLGFQELLAQYLELNVVDGVILPNLKMSGDGERCAFLNGEGRCSIHGFRPGFCRIFPLGRLYEDGSFRYFLQVHECPKENRAKVKVRKWIDTPDLKQYEQFITDWHYFLKEIQDWVRTPEGAGGARALNLYILNEFFVKQYDGQADFYPQFCGRLEEARRRTAAIMRA